ncbi:hypothetical protein POM88_054577 [Heracleum sosnowskyi]|uniref:Uncharacterized protein n=1 Tax=Heracleum sosnowskyi TaxID=360622 RepID=A0AAD8GM28_9APIA|nr:hypothetical protein POM88_054577 [Heracleum sosnowskyi]
MRSRLRGLIQREGAFKVSKHTITNVSRINQCHALSFLLQASQFGEYSTCKYNELQEAAKKSERSHTYRMVKKPKEPERKEVTKGDIIDLHDLLFTENRDYLIKYKDNQKVKAEHLAGKVIVLYFSPLSTDPFYM